MSRTETSSPSAHAVRQQIRQGRWTGHTAGAAPGYLQGNLVVLPAEYALDFARFCQRNPKPCPLIGLTDTGDARLTSLGEDLDLRTDVPAYNIYRHGALSESRTDIGELWQADSVGFALGCSFTFEHALQRAGLALWHIDHNKTVPMYRSTIATTPAGPFAGPVVVSMRALPAERVDEARAISRQFPLAHGAPLHIGDPAAIGIEAIERPDWGDAPPPLGDLVPAFWACGVTPQVAIEGADIPLCITHKPGCMLLTDVAEDAEIPVLSKTPYH